MTPHFAERLPPEVGEVCARFVPAEATWLIFVTEPTAGAFSRSSASTGLCPFDFGPNSDKQIVRFSPVSEPEIKSEHDMTSWSFGVLGFWGFVQNRWFHIVLPPQPGGPRDDKRVVSPAKIPARFAQAPWNEQTDLWRRLDAQLPYDHLARQIRDAMVHLDLQPLYQTYSSRGKAPHPPDLMLAIVLFELRRGGLGHMTVVLPQVPC